MRAFNLDSDLMLATEAKDPSVITRFKPVSDGFLMTAASGSLSLLY